ncbi:hypothetical protein QX204_34255 (plasmid) [Nocardia sp. PE-7]|uniref:hypothetical protein n=1 Tax=Nocardia sp. PE-7 TaxID=3058426 RepID=UPI00265A0BD2|nr:hypothetical protein [Nocardia sp. PE-7]WKG13550.1 hypothetical protein QX204_34255 [Nocardia sp. PE-7]
MATSIDDRDAAIAEALRLRGNTADTEERVRHAKQWAKAIVSNEGRLPHQAHALHLVAVPLSSQIPSRELAQILDRPIQVITAHCSDLESLRFAALLARTSSMAMSKLDSYTDAFYRINRAYALLKKASQNPAAVGDLVFLEAMQQVYLQESGQLARNAEAALVEWRPSVFARQAANPEDIHRPAHSLTSQTRRSIRVLAWGSTLSAFNAMRLVVSIGQIRQEQPQESLYAPTWMMTTENMAMRALLLYTTMAALEGDSSSVAPCLTMIPFMYRSAITAASAVPTTNHIMDLVRVSLHYSFLAEGRTPCRDVTRSKVKPLPSIPEFLRSDTGMLDLDACSTSLLRNNHNAGILDTLAYSGVYDLFQAWSGTTSLDKTFEPWVRQHRARRLHDTNGENLRIRLATPAANRSLDINAEAVSQKLRSGSDRNRELLPGHSTARIVRPAQ